jgi:uncharacterized protein YkwD
MRTYQNKRIGLFISFVSLFYLAVSLISGGHAQAKPLTKSNLDSASDLIAEVNALRKANGLAAYKINAALMFAAQKHSDYQASIHQGTHTGAGGSSPGGRATSAGYGEGARTFVVENIAWGSNMSAQRAVVIWQGDSPHLNTMLSPDFQDAGVGVASDGNTVYFTLDVGYVSGNAAPTAQAGATNTPLTTPTTPKPTGEWISPIRVATALPDGSIFHVVESGQSLYSIADMYQIPIEELLENNNLTLDSLIFPGDRLMIRPVQATLTPTPSETIPPPTATPTSISSPTSKPTQVPPTNTPETDAINEGSMETPDSPGLNKAPGIDPLLLIITILVIVGTGMVILGSLLKRKA